MIHSFEQGVCAVAGVDDQVKGTAFAALPRGLFLTCAHVVLDALKLARDRKEPPEMELRLRHKPEGPPLVARVVGWSPVAEADVALLRATEELPIGFVARPLHDVGALEGFGFDTYGYPAGYHTAKYFGRRTNGTISAEIQTGLLQVEAPIVTHGFSGGPLVDLQMGRTVGMLVASDPPLAFAVPAYAIARVAEKAGVALECLRPARPYQLLTQGLEGLPEDLLERCELLLAHYLGDPAHPATFCGREGEMQMLDTWLMDDAQPCAVIAEPAGRGKTALLVKWAASIAASGVANVAFVPVSNRFDTARRDHVEQIWDARLGQFDGRKAAPLADSKPLQYVMNSLRKPRAAGEPLLLNILDGVDEAINWKLGQDLALPMHPAARVKILVSARLLAGDQGPQGWLDRLHWSAATPVIPIGLLSAEDIAQAVSSAPEWLRKPYAVEALYRLSDQGDPLLVRLLVEQFSKTGPLSEAQLARSKPGFEGYFKSWWQAQKKAWKEQSLSEHPKAKSVRRALASALGPLNREELAHLVPADPEAVSDAVSQLDRHVVGDGVKTGWVFSHPRLREYFREEMGETLRRRWDEAFSKRVEQALVAAEKGRPDEISRYCVQFASAHLERSGAGLHSYRRMTTEGWLRAWQRLEPITFTGYERDIGAAWERSERDEDLALMFRCAWILCMTRSMSGIPPSFLPLLIEEGIATVEQALMLLQRTDYEPHQVESLEALIPALRDDNDRAKVLIFTERFSPGNSTAQLLLLLIPVLSHPLRRTAIQRVYEMAQKLTPDDKAEVIARLYPYLDPEVQPDAMRIALEALKETYWKLSVRPLTALMHIVDEEQARKFWNQAVNDVRDLDAGDTEDAGLLHLLTNAPPALLSRLEMTSLYTSGIHYNSVLSGMLRRIRILRLARPLLRDGTLSGPDLIDFSEEPDRPGARELLRAGLLDFDGPAEAATALAEIEDRIAGQTDEISTATRVELIARGLDSQGVYMREALAAMPELSPSDRAELLTALVRALPEPLSLSQYEQILVHARRSRYAMADLCRKAPPEWRKRAVEDALECRRQADEIDSVLGRMALRLSSRLPMSRREEALACVSGLDEILPYESIAREEGAFRIPNYLIDPLRDAAKVSFNAVAVLKVLAPLAVGKELKTIICEELATRTGLDLSVMVLRAELAPPSRREAVLRLPLQVLEMEPEAARPNEVLGLAKLMNREEGSVLAMNHLFRKANESEEPHRIAARLLLLAKAFPETLDQVADKADELPVETRARMLVDLADVAQPPQRLALLDAALALESDNQTRMLARAKRLTHLAGAERRDETTAVLRDWEQLSLEGAAASLLPVAAVLDPVAYCDMVLKTVDMFLAAARRSPNTELHPLSPALILLADRDPGAAVRALGRIFHTLAGFTEGLMVLWGMQLYLVMEHMKGVGIAEQMFDTVVEVRRWWSIALPQRK